MDAWLQLQRVDPSSCTLIQLRSRGDGLDKASAQLQVQAEAAASQLTALQAAIHAAQAPAVVPAGAAAAGGSKAKTQKGDEKKPSGGAVGAARRTAMSGLLSRADGLSLRLHATSGSHQRLSKAAVALRAQADAVSGLPAQLRELVAGPLARVQAAAGGALVVLDAALHSNETAAGVTAVAGVAAVASSDDASAVLRAVLSDSPLMMEHATVLHQQVEELLREAQAIASDAGKLQVRGQAWGREGGRCRGTLGAEVVDELRGREGRCEGSFLSSSQCGTWGAGEAFSLHCEKYFSSCQTEQMLTPPITLYNPTNTYTLLKQLSSPTLLTSSPVLLTPQSQLAANAVNGMAEAVAELHKRVAKLGRAADMMRGSLAVLERKAERHSLEGTLSRTAAVPEFTSFRKMHVRLKPLNPAEANGGALPKERRAAWGAAAPMDDMANSRYKRPAAPVEAAQLDCALQQQLEDLLRQLQVGEEEKGERRGGMCFGGGRMGEGAYVGEGGKGQGGRGVCFLRLLAGPAI